jgi:hypothetical protein
VGKRIFWRRKNEDNLLEKNELSPPHKNIESNSFIVYGTSFLLILNVSLPHIIFFVDHNL